MDTSQVSAQVRSSEPKRRFRSALEKRGIVEETLEPGASVAKVARAHGVNANQVFAWRRQYRQGLLGKGQAETANLLPVHVTGARLSKVRGTIRRRTPKASVEAAGAIHVELPKGQLRITGRVDAQTLHVVLEQLLR